VFEIRRLEEDFPEGFPRAFLGLPEEIPRAFHKIYCIS
jgi:hypothetical protein